MIQFRHLPEDDRPVGHERHVHGVFTADDLQIAVDDLQHRLRNVIAVIQALANQTFRATDAPQLVQDRFLRRLAALAKTGVLFGNSDRIVDIRDVLEPELAPYGELGSRFGTAGPSVALPARTALMLCAVFHELATNAAKYGAFSCADGRVDTAWRCDLSGDDLWIQFLWCETGGPAVSAPRRKGTGTSLLERAIVGALGGSVIQEFKLTGLCCAIEFSVRPLPANRE